MDAADREHPAIGLTDPPKIKIDEETLESLMQNGKPTDPASPRRSPAGNGDGGEPTDKGEGDLSLHANDDTVIFRRPQL